MTKINKNYSEVYDGLRIRQKLKKVRNSQKILLSSREFQPKFLVSIPNGGVEQLFPNLIHVW